MTKSKLLRLLSRYPSDTRLFKLFDYYKRSLQYTKDELNHKPFSSLHDDNEFSCGYICVSDVIKEVNSCKSIQDLFQIDDKILYGEIKWSLSDIGRELEKLSKNPKYLLFLVDESLKEYEMYVTEHAKEISDIRSQRLRFLKNCCGYLL